MLFVVGRVVPAEHGLTFAYDQIARLGDVVEHGHRRDERGVRDPYVRLAPLGVARGVAGEQRLVELDLAHRGVSVGADLDDAEPGQRVAPIADHDPVGERIGALQAYVRIVGEQRAPIGPVGRIGGGLDQLEVLGAVVVHDQEAVGAVDDDMVDGVLDALAAGEYDPRRLLGLGGVDDVVLAGDLRAESDDQVALAAGGPDADPEAVVWLVEHHDVVCGRGADAMAPHLVWAPCVVDCRVEEVGSRERPGCAVVGVGDRVVK